MPIPAPARDLSHGYILLKYSNGVRTHNQRLHLGEFDPTTGAFIGFDTSAVSVATTMNAYIAAWRNFYNTDWTITPVEVVSHDPVADTFALASCPLPTAQAGHGVPQTPESDYAALEYSIIMGTSIGRRKFRCNLIGSDQKGIGETPILSSGSGGTYAALDTLVAFFQSAACGIRARNGGFPVGGARMTRTFNRRLRRHYGFA